MSDLRSMTLARFRSVRVAWQKAGFLFASLCLLFATLASGMTTSGVANAASRTPYRLLASSFTLDGVTLSLRSAFIPDKFVVSPGDDTIQMASSVAMRPYREFQIEAIPYNVASPLEVLPTAHKGAAAEYRSLLHIYRATHGGHLLNNVPAIVLFGKVVQGEANLLNLNLGGAKKQDAVVTEYVTEAGNRLWLVRMTRGLAQEGLGGHSAADVSSSFLSSLGTVNVSSSTLDRPSTLLASLKSQHPQATTSRGSNPKVKPFNLPFPSWWNGAVCNYNNFLRDTGWQAWQMNSGLYGVYPCGPRPAYGGPDHLVTFFSGAWGEYEFECVELSMRWMYLDWGIHPYSANGKDVVNNFATYNRSSVISEVYNYAGCCMVPEPGDVLSYCSTCTYGHTSVVMSTNVNGSGNGSVVVMEENAVTSGAETLTISNYEVMNTTAGWVYGWLHYY